MDKHEHAVTPSSPSQPTKRWRFSTFPPDADDDEIQDFIERLYATDAEVAELVEQVRLAARAGASRHSSETHAALEPDETT